MTAACRRFKADQAKINQAKINQAKINQAKIKQAKFNQEKTMPTKSKSRRSSSDSESLFDELKQDHKEVKGLLKSILKADEASERGELFSKMKTALTAHSEAEEEMFYPRLENEEESRTGALEAEVEHSIVKNLLTELEAMDDKMSDEWTAKCSVLSDLVEHHVEEEESQIFKDARKVLDKDELTELVGEFESAKQTHMEG